CFILSGVGSCTARRGAVLSERSRTMTTTTKPARTRVKFLQAISSAEGWFFEGGRAVDIDDTMAAWVCDGIRAVKVSADTPRSTPRPAVCPRCQFSFELLVAAG